MNFNEENQTMSPEELRRIELLRNLIALLCRQHWIFFALCFAAVTVLTMAALAFAVMTSEKRYEATANLVFVPQKSADVPGATADSAMQVFSGVSVHKQLAVRLKLTGKKRLLLADRITVAWDAKNANRFTVRVRSRDGEDALRTADTFADLCISEYIKWRKRELNEWQTSFMKRKQDFKNNSTNIENELLALNVKGGTFSLEQSQEELWKELVSGKQALNELVYQETSLKYQLDKLQKQLDKINPHLLMYLDKVKEFRRDLDQNERELERLQLLYTENNPKLIAVMEQYRIKQKKYNDFFAGHAIPAVTGETLAAVDKLKAALKETEEKFEVIAANKRVLTQELARKERASAELRELLPRYVQLKQELEVQQKNISNIERELSDIIYLQTTVRHELSRIDNAVISDEKSPFSVKNIAVSIVAGLAGAGIAASALLGYLIIRGRISGMEELMLYHELSPLGELAGKQPKQLQQLFFSVQNSDMDKKLIFEGSVDCVSYPAALQNALDWNLAMRGKSFCRLKMVCSGDFDFENIHDCNMLSSVFYKGNSGFMPLENISMLSPMEIRMLERDIAELQKSFDVVILALAQPFPCGKKLAEQLFGMCDYMFFLLKKGVTLRASLRGLLRLQKGAKGIPAAILSD